MLLLLTAHCNRNCVYCFETSTLGAAARTRQEISRDDFVGFCNWCLENEVRGIVLAGGEPTLHSDFERIISDLRKRKLNLVLISNLICNPKKLDVLEGDDIKILVNASQEDDKNQALRGMFERNLEKLSALNPQLVLSITLYRPDQDCRHVFDYARRFGIREIRLDVARPSIEGGAQCVLARDLPGYKDKLLEIIETCRECGLELRFDCFFPKEFFSADEVERFDLRDKGLRTERNCNFVVVKPDLTIGTCPHHYLIDKKVTEYESLHALTRDVTAHLNRLKPRRNLGYCLAEDFMIDHD